VDWIVVTRLPVEKDLAPLSHFLRQRGLEHRIVEEQEAQVVAVRDPAAVEPLARMIDEFLAGHIELPLESPPPAPVSRGLSPWRTPVTLLLIGLSILGGLLVKIDIDHAWVPWFTFQGYGLYEFAPLGEGIFAGQIWRLLTPAFLHFGFFHLLFNSLWMWDLGRRLELGLGWKQYLWFVLVTAVAANVAQFWWGGPALFGGMSGVVYALVGFIWLRQYFDSSPVFAVPKSIIAFMLVWLVLCMTGVVDYFIAGSVANAAHVGGLVAGMIWGAFSGLTYRKP